LSTTAQSAMLLKYGLILASVGAIVRYPASFCRLFTYS